MSNSAHDPLDGEINPNHPMTQFARSQWHKVAAFLMFHFEATEVELTPEELDHLSDRNMAVVLHETNGRLFVKFMPMKEAEKLARKHGGMPA